MVVGALANDDIHGGATMAGSEMLPEAVAEAEARPTWASAGAEPHVIAASKNWPIHGRQGETSNCPSHSTLTRGMRHYTLNMSPWYDFYTLWLWIETEREESWVAASNREGGINRQWIMERQNCMERRRDV